MIECAYKPLKSFCQFLHTNWPSERLVKVIVKPQHHVIKWTNGQSGFGVYLPEWERIYIGGKRLPEMDRGERMIDHIRYVLAHEYCHFLQHGRGVNWGNEEVRREAEFEAEMFAEHAMLRFKKPWFGGFDEEIRVTET